MVIQRIIFVNKVRTDYVDYEGQSWLNQRREMKQTSIDYVKDKSESLNANMKC